MDAMYRAFFAFVGENFDKGENYPSYSIFLHSFIFNRMTEYGFKNTFLFITFSIGKFAFLPKRYATF